MSLWKKRPKRREAHHPSHHPTTATRGPSFDGAFVVWPEWQTVGPFLHVTTAPAPVAAVGKPDAAG